MCRHIYNWNLIEFHVKYYINKYIKLNKYELQNQSAIISRSIQMIK